ncbi:unnamed protein product [Fusarium venenatum]|uniref:Uncharacterized protein n=1 Tax=Fusarium venenatum TaxID=56646 RepID=A0A2L2TD85_9HYPO|nr:uncharacterized protein FVRRES_07996 [Fusarium venenatum]CEI67919.1 unnamed protein product [Fusarium venenatum]
MAGWKKVLERLKNGKKKKSTKTHELQVDRFILVERSGQKSQAEMLPQRKLGRTVQIGKERTAMSEGRDALHGAR